LQTWVAVRVGAANEGKTWSEKSMTESESISEAEGTPEASRMSESAAVSEAGMTKSAHSARLCGGAEGRARC
jgi:hypothetical protein